MGGTARGSRLVRVLIGCCMLLGLWIGWRVVVSLQVRAEQRETRRHAEAMARQTGGKRGVRVIYGVPDRWQPVVALDGTLIPLAETDVSFQVGGRLATLQVARGDRVRAGAVLATLASEEVGVQVAAIEAQVRGAESQLRLAEDSWARVRLLVDAGAGSDSLRVQSEAQRDMVVSQLQALQAQLALVRLQQKHHTLHAPFEGVVTKIPSGVGGMVAPGPPLFHLADLRTFKLVGSVGEQEASWIRPGAPVRLVDVDGEFVGKVTTVLSMLDPMTRRVLVEAQIPATSAQKGLRAGAWVRAEIRPEGAEAVLRLPATALRPGSQDEVIWIHEGALHTRRVQFVRTPKGDLLVRRGLLPTEPVWISPTPELTEGQPVEVESSP